MQSTNAVKTVYRHRKLSMCSSDEVDLSQQAQTRKVSSHRHHPSLLFRDQQIAKKQNQTTTEISKPVQVLREEETPKVPVNWKATEERWVRQECKED
jgi:hypothetical protein